MIPKLLEIPLPFGFGALPVHTFGLMMMFCFLAAWRRLSLSLAAEGEEPALAERMVTWAALGGIAGAKFAYIASYPQEFLSSPFHAVFGGAGFVFYGGFVGGAVAVWLLLRMQKKSFFRMADLTAPCLALGYAVGRIGCQLSGDGDYGLPAALPWAMGYRLGVVPTPPGMLVHPTPVYETAVALLITAVLLSGTVRRLLPEDGQRFGLYLCLSAAARMAVEVLRIEPRIWLGFTQAQLIGALLFCAGFWLLVHRPIKA